MCTKHYCIIFVTVSKYYNDRDKDDMIEINNIIADIINTTLNSFDIPFCITVNVATYIIINSIIAYNSNIKLNTWHKRIILIIVSIIVALVYCYTGSDYKIIFNSFILAPVSWSWIFKPICNKLKVDYSNKALED